MMTKKHFNTIAHILNEELERQDSNTVVAIARRLADYFKTQNPMFDKQRFIEAVLE